MKKSLHAIGISLLFLFGLYSVSSKAASINSLNIGFNSALYNSVLYNNISVYLDIDDYYELTIFTDPTAIHETHQIVGFGNSFGLPKLDESTLDESTTADADIDAYAKLNDDENHGLDNNYSAIYAETDDINDMIGMSSFGLPRLDEDAPSMELLEIEDITPTSTVTSDQSLPISETVTDTSSTEMIVSLKETVGSASEFADNTSMEENNISFLELEIYAMLLVFLGMMGFTARRRRDII